ncbi:MAG: hypothetical protein KatS3mg035_1128 [Bacteroidia bacterium]|nr:MAG: hypothetical protein KatS3mg035_1128 [Bacteroidia bacterium]
MDLKKYIRQIIKEELSKIKQEMYFIRNTSAPEADLKRNFSCHVWKQTEQEAIEYQKAHGALTKPKYDEYSNRWCADPELGLSSFAFNDEKSFKEAMVKIEQYAYDDKIALFISNDYDLDAGLDGEDVFRNGRFIKYINWNTTFNEITSAQGI